MPKIFCCKCGGVHLKGECPSDSIPPSIEIPTANNTPKKSKRLCDMNEEERRLQQFYNSTEWRKKRQEIIERARGMCEVCWACGLIREGKEVHHIVKLRDDWNLRLNNNNLILLCTSCHHQIEDCCDSIESLIKFIERKKKEKK